MMCMQGVLVSSALCNIKGSTYGRSTQIVPFFHKYNDAHVNQ
jgi:hypothetical protein